MSFQVLEIRRTTFNGSTIQYSNATFFTPTRVSWANNGKTCKGCSYWLVQMICVE